MTVKFTRLIPCFRHVRVVIPTLPLAAVLVASALHAQVDQGSISGTVTDSSGAVVPGAKVTLVDTDTNLTLTRMTSNGGVYTFTPIKIGNYTLKVDASGFQSVVRENIHINVSEELGINLMLKAGSETQTVTVTAQPDLQTEDASTGQVFNTQTITDTPLENRNYVFIAQLTTGVAAPNQGFGQVAGAGDFTSNGNRVSQNNFVLDGVDNNSNMQDFLNGATYAVRPPPDALSEFKVQSSDYSAELGHSTGAAINASIKSGTNQIHGSLWEYFRSDRLAAQDYFSTGRTAYHQNIFGATFGGPVIKDKLFFFADAEGTRVSTFVPDQPNYTVPTDLEKTGNFSQLLDPGNTAGEGAIALYQTGGDSTPSAGAAETAGTPRAISPATACRTFSAQARSTRLPRECSSCSRSQTRVDPTRYSRTTPCLQPPRATTLHSTISASTTISPRKTRRSAAIAILIIQATLLLHSASSTAAASGSAVIIPTRVKAAFSAKPTSSTLPSRMSSAWASITCSPPTCSRTAA